MLPGSLDNGVYQQHVMIPITTPTIFGNGTKSVVSSPVTEACLRLEGTVILAAAQTAALITAQRRDQVDWTWATHRNVQLWLHVRRRFPLLKQHNNELLNVENTVSVALQCLTLKHECTFSSVCSRTYHRYVQGPGDTGSRASGESRGASGGPGRTAPPRCTDNPVISERLLWRHDGGWSAMENLLNFFHRFIIAVLPNRGDKRQLKTCFITWQPKVSLY